jgi:peroxiredoxin Q/BCP
VSDESFGAPATVEQRILSMQRLRTGDKAPEFTAVSHRGETVRLSDFLGKRGLVLFFYPKNGTFVCTKEACAFRDSYAKFADAGVEVLGVSGDSDESHRKFATDHQLNFPLISDTDGKLRRLFTVPKTLGIFPGRVTYVIDRQGIIRKIYSAQLASAEHVRQAIDALSLGNATSDFGDNAASSAD